MWENLNVSDYYASMETKMWDQMSSYVDIGNRCSSPIHDQKRFRGWPGPPDGCSVKQITMLALSTCIAIPDAGATHVFVYFDGSSTAHDYEPILT